MSLINKYRERIVLSKNARNILFSDSAREFYKYGIYKTYSNCLEYKREHLLRMLKIMNLDNLSNNELIGQNVIIYIQLTLRRSLILLTGCIESVRSNNPLSAVLNVRAHYEVTGAIGYLSSKLKKYYAKEVGDEEIIEILSRLNLGRKKEELKKPFESINVLSMIDEADKIFMKKSGEKTKILRDSYEWLSEFCHPNAYGLLCEANFKKDKIIEFKASKEKIIRQYKNLEYLEISMPIFFLFYNYVIELLQENEEKRSDSQKGGRNE